MFCKICFYDKIERGDVSLVNRIIVNINKLFINSLDMFFSINGRYSNHTKDSYFIRYIGFEKNENLSDKIILAENRIKEGTIKRGYYRTSSLDTFISPDKLQLFLSMYERIKNSTGTTLPYTFTSQQVQDLLLENLYEVIKTYTTFKQGATDSMIKNFAVKLLFWIHTYFPKLFPAEFDLSVSSKFLYLGDIKEQEYLFLYLLARQGCDVIYINPLNDAKISPSFLNLSSLCQKECTGSIDLPVYKAEEPTVRQVTESHPEKKSETAVQPAAVSNKINPKHPARNSAREKTALAPAPQPKTPAQGERKELDYTEIANMASSVVMISVYNQNNECFKTGSGVIIGEKGYILTNFHVVGGGHYYSVNMENEQQQYMSFQILKYNPDLDLALIRIEKTCRPIAIFRGQNELVRGQKVVAIGSPLGLFNSVSDGIISGFRVINYVHMIQYTAPTSPGSSGGALLNMYGELIGLSTAGMENAQNINLAVDYKTILEFVKGFIN